MIQLLLIRCPLPSPPLPSDYFSKVLMHIEELEATMSREALETEGSGGCILM